MHGYTLCTGEAPAKDKYCRYVYTYTYPDTCRYAYTLHVYTLVL